MTNLPVTGIFRVTCPYHKQGKKWAAGHHTGIDIVSTNRKVYGTCDGVVYHSGFDKSYGNYIVVHSNEDDTYHWFCHLETRLVGIGKNVSRGTVLGIMGNTGNSTGTHLHYEIRKSCNCYDRTEDPSIYMGIPNKNGFYNSKDYNLEDTVPKFIAGDIVYIPCKFTGATRGESSLIEIEDGLQVWVYNSILNKDKNKAKCIVCYVDIYKLMLEIDSITPDIKQFWVEKNIVSFDKE